MFALPGVSFCLLGHQVHLVHYEGFLSREKSVRHHGHHADVYMRSKVVLGMPKQYERVQMLERLSSPDQPQYQTISFIYWLQWHLSKQLKSASEFARQHQIALKGDLPIGWILSC